MIRKVVFLPLYGMIQKTLSMGPFREGTGEGGEGLWAMFFESRRLFFLTVIYTF